MKFKLRPYQEEASKKAVEFFLDEKKNWNALEVLPTASGKSLILADIAARLKDKVLVSLLLRKFWNKTTRSIVLMDLIMPAYIPLALNQRKSAMLLLLQLVV